MKRLTVITLLAALACLPLRADTVADTYKQGVAAMQEGNVEGARIAFNEVLRQQPNNANARYQLNELNTHQDSIAARAREKELAKYTIDKVEFSDLEASEAIAALNMMVEKKSEGKFSPNFTIKDPDKLLEKRTVTLNLKGVPANGVLKMILEQANAMARYDKYAIAIEPRASAGAAPAPAPAPAPKKEGEVEPKPVPVPAR